MIIRKRINDAEMAKAKKKAKEREKRRKKMIRTKYGQTQRRHAKKGIKACICAFFALFFLFLMIANSYVENGQVGVLMGIAGFLIFALSVSGTKMAVQGFKERDKNYITCKIGLGCNVAVVLCTFAIFVRGLI